jgi:hypothetical protein
MMVVMIRWRSNRSASRWAIDELGDAHGFQHVGVVDPASPATHRHGCGNCSPDFELNSKIQTSVGN